MKNRPILAALALAAALAAPPSLTAQAVRLPDSLEWTRLPSDPADFPARIKAGEIWMRSLDKAGCPSDGGYAKAAHDALVKAAETDRRVRDPAAFDYGTRLKLGAPVCPNDLPLYEAMLVKWVRQEWEAGWLGPESPKGQTGTVALMFGELGHGTDPATYDLLRSIARDPDVYVEPGRFRDGNTIDLRRDAARSMLAFRINGGMGEAEAVKAVAADLAGAPPVYDWRPPGYPGGG